ncbi:MAG: hypothetical protein DCC66_10920 [Planctomycetota bacterium]|nr:MAG: hypothetical protein DCC66_10920 [Planctomycetota bacterium]
MNCVSKRNSGQVKVTGRLDVGSTGNLTDRLARHNRGQSKSTRHDVPRQLVHCEGYSERSQAVQQERYYKSGWGQETHRRLLAGGLAGERSPRRQVESSNLFGSIRKTDGIRRCIPGSLISR